MQILSEESDDGKKNILQIVPTLNCGGVERGTIDVARAIHDSGQTPYVLSSGGSLCGRIKEIPTHLIKHNVSSKNPIRMLSNIFYIEKLIKREKIDLVHARSRAPAWSAYYACKRTNTPFITTFHGIYSLKNSLKRYYNSVMTKGQIVIAVSNFVKEHILKNYGVDEKKIRVIYRGVDLEYFNPELGTEVLKNKFTEKYNIPSSVPVIIMPSRLTSWKGQNILIDALSTMKDKDFYCLFVGDLASHPDYVERLKNLIMKHKLQSKVQIFGPETNMLGLYNRADIVVSASIEPEAFGRSNVEAQAMAKIVIATNIGGSAETIEDGVTGFHVKPGDHLDMAEKIKYALSILGTKEAEKMTKLARKSVEDRFSLKQMQDSTLAVYDEILGKPKISRKKPAPHV